MWGLFRLPSIRIDVYKRQIQRLKRAIAIGFSDAEGVQHIADCGFAFAALVRNLLRREGESQEQREILRNPGAEAVVDLSKTCLLYTSRCV